MYAIDWFAVQVLAAAGLLGLIVGIVADKRRRSFVGWWIFGTALFIVALPLVFILPALDDPWSLKRCPKCAEMIWREASTCQFCRYEFGADDDWHVGKKC
jgi:hypothetical protein